MILLKNGKTFNLAANQTYYFDVDVNEQGVSTLTQIAPGSALANLKNMDAKAIKLVELFQTVHYRLYLQNTRLYRPGIFKTQSPVLAEKGYYRSWSIVRNW